MFKILSDEISGEIWDLLIYTTGLQCQSRLKTSLGYNAEAIVYWDTGEWVAGYKEMNFFLWEEELRTGFLCVALIILKLSRQTRQIHRDLPAPASWTLGLKVCTTSARLKKWVFKLGSDGARL